MRRRTLLSFRVVLGFYPLTLSLPVVAQRAGKVHRIGVLGSGVAMPDDVIQ